jgi:hypothetical protein
MLVCVERMTTALVPRALASTRASARTKRSSTCRRDTLRHCSGASRSFSPRKSVSRPSTNGWHHEKQFK